MALPGVPDGMGGTFGGLVTQGNARRGTEVLHRSGITAIDTLATPGVPTASDVVETSASLAASPMHFAVAAGNKYGPTTATLDAGAVTPTINHGLKVVVAQVTGADYYDIFLSTAVAPLWVGRITEAQRATGDQAIVTVGTVTARSSATVAGTIVVGIVGTGVAHNVAPFNVNNAFTPTAVGITPVSMVGCNGFWLTYKVTATDFRSLPSVFIALFRNSVLAPADWFLFSSVSSVLLTSGIPLLREAAVTVQGGISVVALVMAISGQGTSVDIYLNPVT